MLDLGYKWDRELSNREKYEMSYRLNDTQYYVHSRKEAEKWLKEDGEWNNFIKDIIHDITEKKEEFYNVAWSYDIPLSIVKVLAKTYIRLK